MFLYALLIMVPLVATTTFPGASAVRNLPAVKEMDSISFNQQDPLEKEMATHSSIIAWRIPQSEEPGGLESMRLQELDMT